MSTISDLHEEIASFRKKRGKRLLILGHHYQRDEVIVHTDLQGDSFQLSAAAAENIDCETIVFCGVHFMAETADILANSRENLVRRGGRRVDVLLPDLEAGCPMADMATREALERCWNELATVIDVDDVVPITYVNSSAALKAFCGSHGGAACTSTNARAVLDWALSHRASARRVDPLPLDAEISPEKISRSGASGIRKNRVLFFPDQHLGRNTALTMGIPESAMPLWRQDQPGLGGNTPDSIRNSRVILWDGYCNVHRKFTPENIEAIRKKEPGIRVIVHPECCRTVVEQADEFGSTSLILRRITESPAGSKWAVGTESRFVERLARQNPDKTILNLNPEPSYCETMGLIDLPKLAEILRSIESGTVKNVIRVDDATAVDALACLKRMLACP